VSPRMRSWLAWLLPFLVAPGLVIGATVGLSMFSDAAHEPGPAGDIAGAAGALIAAICLTGGFTVSLLAVVVSKLLRRGAPTRLLLRVALSLVDGLAVAAVGAGKGSFQLAQIAGAILIFVVPALLSWTWQRAAVPDAQ
jgi:hypothetical protein